MTPLDMGSAIRAGRFRSLIYIVLIAFAVRLAVVYFVYPSWLNPKRDYYEFGYEPGRVARSLALGRGFSDPLHGQTGPTALVMPVYPAILAACFKTLGIYSKGAAIAILSFNSLISALTCIPVFLIGFRTFDQRTGLIAAWVWAFWPNAIYFSANWMWATCLATFLLSLLFLMVLRMQASASLAISIVFGLASGLAALTEPNVMSVLPVLGGWACYRLYRRRQPWVTPALAASAAFLVLVSPWFIRNYEVFHRFIPFRDGFGLELYVGNNGYSAHWANTKLRPSNSADELAEYARSGELAYMDHKKQQALAFIESHQSWYVKMCLRRFLYLWTGYWSFAHDYLEGEPMDPANVAVNLVLLGFVAIGFRRAWRDKRERMVPYLAVFLLFPVVYCLTHPEVYYMRPVDPFLIVIAAYALNAFRWRKTSQQKTDQDSLNTVQAS